MLGFYEHAAQHILYTFDNTPALHSLHESTEIQIWKSFQVQSLGVAFPLQQDLIWAVSNMPLSCRPKLFHAPMLHDRISQQNCLHVVGRGHFG